LRVFTGVSCGVERVKGVVPRQRTRRRRRYPRRVVGGKQRAGGVVEHPPTPAVTALTRSEAEGRERLASQRLPDRRP